MAPVGRSVSALLKMSETVAERASLPRFTLTKSPPRQQLRVAQKSVGPASEYVTFTPEELTAMGIARSDLAPFEFTLDLRQSLTTETIGHTALKRRAIVFSEGRVLLVLPTAALRRYMMESAVAAGTLERLQEMLTSRIAIIRRISWRSDASGT
jgi:hypothetical protein